MRHGRRWWWPWQAGFLGSNGGAAACDAAVGVLVAMAVVAIPVSRGAGTVDVVVRVMRMVVGEGERVWGLAAVVLGLAMVGGGVGGACGGGGGGGGCVGWLVGGRRLVSGG